MVCLAPLRGFATALPTALFRLVLRRSECCVQKKQEKQDMIHAELQTVIRASQNTVEQLEMELHTVNREKVQSILYK